MDDRTTFRKHIRDALAHLYDTAHLECHPLVSQLLTPTVSNRLTQAQMLRRLLKEVVEALRPRQGNPSSAPEWRSYLALRSLYIKGARFLEVQEELGISRRQLQREVSKGLDALTAILWDRRMIEAQHPGPVMTDAGEAQLLHQELENWPLHRQACTVQALVDDVRWLLNPLLNNYEVTLQVTLPPDLPTVFVDPTLTRQALFRILRLMVQTSERHQVSLIAEKGPKEVNIILSGRPIANDPLGQDWEIAHLLLSDQGGELRPGNSTEAETQIVINLPLVSLVQVFVIDDAQGVQRLFERYLAPHDYQVTGTHDGVTALQQAAKLKPDLIILDVMMPAMDGWQVLRGLQNDPRTADIPVVVCSVLNEPDLALALGARAFVKKPVNRLTLLNTLEQLRGVMASARGARREGTGDR